MLRTYSPQCIVTSLVEYISTSDPPLYNLTDLYYHHEDPYHPSHYRFAYFRYFFFGCANEQETGLWIAQFGREVSIVGSGWMGAGNEPQRQRCWRTRSTMG